MSAVKEAFKNVGYKYSPTRHAVDRALLRFGISDEEVYEWFNDLMREAKLVTKSNNDYRRTIYAAEYNGEHVRMIVDVEHNIIRTVFPRVSANFLRPALERELRKLRRQYTRRKRQKELEYAESMRELADMAINRARARNPQTRALIAGRMADKQAEIDAMITEIERLNDEWEAKKRAIELIAE